SRRDFFEGYVGASPTRRSLLVVSDQPADALAIGEPTAGMTSALAPFTKSAVGGFGGCGGGRERPRGVGSRGFWAGPSRCVNHFPRLPDLWRLDAVRGPRRLVRRSHLTSMRPAGDRRAGRERRSPTAPPRCV